MGKSLGDVFIIYCYFDHCTQSSAALCLSALVREGIGYVVNAADACVMCLLGKVCGTCVRTRPAYYELDKIKLKSVAALDDNGFPLYKYFQEVTDFIDEAVNGGGEAFKYF